MRTIVIWGAGRIGRGFVADMFHVEGWRTVFVDIDADLVCKLNRNKAYTIFKAQTTGITQTRISDNFTALHTSQTRELNALFEEEGLLLDIAVHKPKLPEVADMVAPLLRHRAAVGAGSMDIMMNVNMAEPNVAFAKLLEERLQNADLAYYREHIGITGIAAMCISPIATDAMFAQDELALLNNGYFEQAIGRHALKGEIPVVPRIRICEDVQAEEIRKLYTLNMAHATCCYLGVQKGLHTVIEVMRDAELRQIVVQALDEAVFGLSHAYSFDENTMRNWSNIILELLDNPYIDDNLPRLGADTKRKLYGTDRLCGAAQLCVQAGRKPYAIAKAIRAGYDFKHDDEGTIYVQTRLEQVGLENALTEISQLSPKDELYSLILSANP